MSLEHDITEVMRLLESLDEGIASAKKLYLDTNKIAKTPFERLVALDVTPQKKYAEWMVRTYVKNKMHYGDISKFGVIKDFEDLCTKNKIEAKDINQYKTVEEVYDLVKKYEDVKTQGEIEKAIKHEGAEVTFENDKVIVIFPKTREASCFYGKGTKWCTAGDVYNYFNDYFYERAVNLYYVIPKTGENKDKIAVAVNSNGSKEYYASDDSKMPEEKAKRKIASLMRKPRIKKEIANES